VWKGVADCCTNRRRYQWAETNGRAKEAKRRGAGRDLVWNPVPGKEKKQEKTEIEWYGWIFVLTSYYH